MGPPWRTDPTTHRTISERSSHGYWSVLVWIHPWFECTVDSLSRYRLFNTTGRKEGNVLFNHTLNTFYLRLYGVRHMVKDHSDSERGNLLPPHRLLFPISSKGSFICIIPQTGWHIPEPLLHQSWSTGTRNSSMGPLHEGSIWRPIAPWANALTTELHLASLTRQIWNLYAAPDWKNWVV